ncbi:hypothetical protein [Kitasatospora sp. NPDC057223]|uniref:hypothetical protein n=1 Tax=Kitasatospora sp. NPDC057223 TaxID=3346055 RepID=UPI00363FE94D
MTTQGHRDPQTPGQAVDGRPDRARPATRSTPVRVLGWCVVVAVVAGVGWIVSRPQPGDWIPGLGPSSADATKTPPVLGNPVPPTVTDPEGLTADRYFPAQRTIEADGYRGRRLGVRQGQDCAEVLQDRAVDPLHDSGCQGFIAVSFTGVDQPVYSSITVLRFADDAAAEKAAQALRVGEGAPGAIAFILPDASAAPAPAGGAKAVRPPRVEAVGHYLTVTASRLADAHTTAPATASPGATGGAAASPAASPTVSESQLDAATRAISYAAASQFIWS